MKRTHWGEFEDNKVEIKREQIIQQDEKADKLKNIKTSVPNTAPKIDILKMKNQMVAQTVEVMNEGAKFPALVNSIENQAINCVTETPTIPCLSFLQEDKFAKPFWFIPPIPTKFSRGIPKTLAKINKPTVKTVLRKSVCGLIRMAGFTDALDSAVELFVDAVDEFYKNLLTQVRDVLVHEEKDKQNHLDVLSLEKGYYSFTQNSLVSIHNYFKNEIIGRNRNEINQYKEDYDEYNKILKRSFMEFGWKFQNDSDIVINMESDNNIEFKEIMEGELIETTNDDKVHFATLQQSS